jgi:hypothetical protein
MGMHEASGGVKQKWKQVLESIQREVNMTSDTLNLKRQFSVSTWVFEFCIGRLWWRIA